MSKIGSVAMDIDKKIENLFKPRSEDTIRGILMSLGSFSDGKKEYIEKRLRGLNSSELINLKSLIYKEENVLQRLNLVYQAMAKADEDRLIKERENRQKNEIGKELSEGFQNRIYPKLQILQSKLNELLGIKDPNKKNDDLLMYGLIAVVGYLLYKKFKNWKK